MRRNKVKVHDPNKVDLELVDPMGWTLENNPHPSPYVTDHLDINEWQNWFEWDEEGFDVIVCHSCLCRAMSGNGNCVDGGEYFAPCKDEKLKLLNKRKQGKPKVTYQSTLF